MQLGVVRVIVTLELLLLFVFMRITTVAPMVVQMGHTWAHTGSSRSLAFPGVRVTRKSDFETYTSGMQIWASSGCPLILGFRGGYCGMGDQ